MTTFERILRSADPPPAAGGGGEPMSDKAAEALAAAMAAVSSLQDEVDAAAASAANTPVSDDSAPASMSGGGGVGGGAMFSANPSPAAVQGTPSAFQPPIFDTTVSPAAQKAIDLLADVNLNVKIELGRTRMAVEDVLRLAEGAVVELDKLAGDPVDIYVNERPIARGEVLVLNDNFCVRINEILQPISEQVKNGGAG
jgi:flagellar motor switch protein FliN